MKTESARSTEEKIEVYRRFFTGLTHVYGTYDLNTGEARMVKAPVTDQVIRLHLRGLEPYGVYLLTGDRTRAVVADFDSHDPLPPQEFVAVAKHYGLQACIEPSKSKGFHVWVFLEEEGISAAKARIVAHHILNEIEASETEVFPKHDRLSNRVHYGNFIHAPLFGALVPEGRTVFVSPDSLQPYPNQWDFLESVQRVPESHLDEIIAVNALVMANVSGQTTATGHPESFATTGLPICARRILEEGVLANQRVTSFRLAVHLNKAGLPFDIAVAALKAWALKNRPEEGRRIITEQEILEQAEWAYKNGYRGCGCEEAAIKPFCDSRCPIYRKQNCRTL